MPKSILITGGCGFIGHHICEHIMKSTDWNIFVIDKLNYASFGLNRLRGIDILDDARLKVFTCDLSGGIPEGIRDEIGSLNYIIHAAAETHVTTSIHNAAVFLKANVIGTLALLNYTLKLPTLSKFIYLSTDEVFGPAPLGVAFKEWARYNTTNPYSASKAAAEQLCLAYSSCHNLPMIIVHCMNAFGERQHPEKFIPMATRAILKGQSVPIHIDHVTGEICNRYWIHARNIADALLYLLALETSRRDVYNIAGVREASTLEIASIIAMALDKPLKHHEIVPGERPGNDSRYCLDGSKLSQAGWSCPIDFEESLIKTIHWMKDNPEWLYL